MTLGYPIPPSLDARPKDRRRGLPVPYTQGSAPDGEPDFTAVDAAKGWTAGRDRLCGLCGLKMDYWVAFVGGPGSVEARSFLDGPSHKECALAALDLCPHIAIRATRRATKHTAVDVTTPAGFVEDKPREWYVYVTREYELLRTPQAYVFRPAPPKELLRFVYGDDDRLHPEDT